MKPEMALRKGSDTNSPYVTLPPHPSPAPKCDSHFPDGKIEATRPRAAQLESCCSGSEFTLLSPLLHSHEASEPAGSEEPQEGAEEHQCHICVQGETWRLRKQLGQRWERPGESSEGPEQRRN